MESWILPCSLITKNSSSWLDMGWKQLNLGVFVFDMSSVTQLDSSFIAALLCWIKYVKKPNSSNELRLLNAHPALLSLLALYEMSSLLKDQVSL